MSGQDHIDNIASGGTESTPLLVGDGARPLCKRPSPYWALMGLFTTNLATTFLTAPILQFVLAAVCENYYDAHERTNGTVPRSIGNADLFTLGYSATDERCKIPEVQQGATRVFQLTALFGTLSMITFWTTLSDRRGRRFALFFSATAQIADMLVLILYVKYWRVLGVYFLVLRPIIGGVAGSGRTMFTICFAYVADCVPQEKRNVFFGRLCAANSFAGVIGPALSAYVFERVDQSTVTAIYMSLGLFIFWWLSVIFLLPESNTQQIQAVATVSTQQPQASKSIFHNLNVFAALTIVFSNSTLPYMAIIHFLMNISVYGIFQIMLLYPSLKFGWGTWEDGIFLSLLDFESMVVLLVLIPVIRHIFKKRSVRMIHRSSLTIAPSSSSSLPSVVPSTTTTPNSLEESTEWTEAETVVAEETYNTDVTNVSALEPVIIEELMPPNKQESGHDNITSRRDSWMVVFGVMFKMFGFLGYAFAQNGWMYYGSITFQALATIYSPSIRSMLTTIVAPNQAGTILGAATVLEVTSGVLAPLIYSTIYFATVQSQPNLVFLLCALNMMVALALAVNVAVMERTKKNTRLGRVSSTWLG
ncbi:major facilitator superfamily domain-containing protein [Jimgerdemannia flammicorona]|uniref:Major facilitator superfamily domain-containing protein n=1 Tax=Jimgerdemannia flammicorona TaxID=994334 RepID=A0A433Q2A0_9FUNG|nr:major facilitator superfamily domain-containing protein [Jimgerdemannia flammicorona]